MTPDENSPAGSISSQDKVGDDELQNAITISVDKGNLQYIKYYQI